MKRIESTLLSSLNIRSCLVASSEDWRNFGESEWRSLVEALYARPPLERVLGLDAEWFKKNPLAVVQFSTSTHCVVLHLSYLEGRALPVPVREVLENSSVIKCGVGVSGDVKRLVNEQRVTVKSVMDIECYCVWLGLAQPQSGTGLKALAQNCCQLEMEKSELVTRSNWELPLSEEQARYAAEDAVTSFAVGQRVMQELRRKFPDTLAKSDLTTEDLLSLLKQKETMAKRAHKAAMKAYSAQQQEKHLQARGEGKGQGKGGRGGHGEDDSSSKKPLSFQQIDNGNKVKVLGKDGQFLFECSSGKAKYYVLQKDLAKVVQCRDNNPRKPTVIQFNFDPKLKTRLCMFHKLDVCELGENCAFAHSVDELTPEAQQLLTAGPSQPSCACCLGTKDLHRHSIVPPSFMRFLPASSQLTKKKGSLDAFVPLCAQCHMFINKLYEDKIKDTYGQADRRAQELGYPVNQTLRMSAVGKCISYARLLINEVNLKKIPEERQMALAEFICRHWRETHLLEMTRGDCKIDEEGVATAAAVRENKDFLTHLSKIVAGEVQARVTLDLLLRALPNPDSKGDNESNAAETKEKMETKEKHCDPDNDGIQQQGSRRPPSGPSHRSSEVEGEEDGAAAVVHFALADESSPEVEERTRAFLQDWRNFCFEDCKMIQKDSNLMSDEEWKVYRETQKIF